MCIRNSSKYRARAWNNRVRRLVVTFNCQHQLAHCSAQRPRLVSMCDAGAHCRVIVMQHGPE
eukprot:1975063-Alexandrium_andersonii.AAC.1